MYTSKHAHKYETIQIQNVYTHRKTSVAYSGSREPNVENSTAAEVSTQVVGLSAATCGSPVPIRSCLEYPTAADVPTCVVGL